MATTWTEIDSKDITMSGAIQGVVVRCCKNCRYWVGGSDERVQTHKKCMTVWLGNLWEEDGYSSTMPVEDSGIMTREDVFTGPNFGCIHFEGKEDE